MQKTIEPASEYGPAVVCQVYGQFSHLCPGTVSYGHDQSDNGLFCYSGMKAAHSAALE